MRLSITGAPLLVNDISTKLADITVQRSTSSLSWPGDIIPHVRVEQFTGSSAGFAESYPGREEVIWDAFGRMVVPVRK
jgi:hypothetical protein